MTDRAAHGRELRAEGRTLHGLAMPYGEVSPSHRERFLPGSLRPVDDVYLNIQHDLSQTIAWRGAGLSLADSADGLRIEAGPFPRTPIHNAVLADVNAGKLRGVSVEFRAQRERTDPQTGIRVIEAAALKGFGLVPDPSYPSARVTEVRARIGGRISGRANLGRPVSCRCRTGCDSIQIEPDAMDAALAEAEAGTRQIHAFFSGRYDRPLASVGAGLTLRRTGDALEVSIDGIPDTQDSRDWLETVGEGAGFYAIRPYFPDDQSIFRKDGRTAVFSEADLRAIEIAAVTGPTEGLERVTVRRRRESRARRRRVWL